MANEDWSDNKRTLCVDEFDGFIGEYIEYAASRTDAYHEYHYMGALNIVSSIIGRRKQVPMNCGTIYPNLYIFVLGFSTSSRKSASTNIMNSVMKSSAFIDYLPSAFSYESFIEEMSDNPVRALVVDEAGTLLKNLQRNYMSETKDLICHLYDGQDFYRKLRSKKDKYTFNITDPFLNIFFATVPDTLYNCSTIDDVSSGWFARFLFAHPRYGRDRRPFELLTNANRDDETNIIRRAREIDVWLSKQEHPYMTFDDGVFEYYQKWSMSIDDEMCKTEDEKYNMVMGRMIGYVVKIALIHAVSRLSDTILMSDLKNAIHAVETFFVPCSLEVMTEVEQQEQYDITAKKISLVIRYLKKHQGRASRRQLLRATKTKVRDFTEIMHSMTESGSIRVDNIEDKGENSTIWYCLQDNH